jgi:hypothetical protein
VPTIRTTLIYSFDELDCAAQARAIRAHIGINVDNTDWWEYIYTDADAIGLKISEFDLGNAKKIRGKLTVDLPECCRLIRANHGKDCETFKTARRHLKEYTIAFAKWRKTETLEHPGTYEDYSIADWWREFADSDIATDVTVDFERMLLQDYFSILDKEYDYQTDDDAVRDSIRCCELEFLENGNPA